jgi:hypothetical protein
VCRSPEPGPIQGNRGVLSVLLMRPLVVLPRDGGGGGGEVSMTPIERVANRTILVKLLSSDPSGHPCPVP